MRRAWFVTVVLGLALAAPEASAAHRTELIDFLHFDAEVGYAGGIQFGRLRELDASDDFLDVAKYNQSRHEMNVDIEFGIAPMLEFDVRFPIVFEDRLNYGWANDMSYDPVEDRATMLGTSPLPDDLVPDDKRGGFGDMWLALQFCPFHEGYTRRAAKATMMFELGVAPPTGKSRYEVNDRGVMWPGSGGTDLRVAGAFSKRIKAAEPYFTARYVMTGRYDVELYDRNGASTYGGAIKLNPADTVSVLFGNEIHAMNNPARDTEINIDIFGGFTYHTWADIETGTLLPVIHPDTEGYIATTAEYLEPHFGLGLYIRPVKMMQIRVNLGADYEVSHLLERIDERNFEVYSGTDTLRVNFGLTVVGSFEPPEQGPLPEPPSYL